MEDWRMEEQRTETGEQRVESGERRTGSGDGDLARIK